MVARDQMEKHITMSEVLDELKRMKEIALPIAGINLVSYLKNMVAVVCMGRLGRLELAGGALAVGFTNVTGYSVLAGLAMGMEPVCSQAFGSGNHSLASRTLRRTILMLLLVSAAISMMWINLRPLMLCLRQDPDVARIAATYCLFALPDLLANSFLNPIRIYFRSQGTPAPLMWCMSIAVVLHVPLTVFLSSAIGVPGVAIATWATNFSSLFLLLAYVSYTSLVSDDSTVYIPLAFSPSVAADVSEKASAEWVSLLRLALPSCLGVCLEWWWYELMTMASGYLRNPHVNLAAAAIVIQTTSLMYTLPITLSTAVSARVGNELGAGQPRRARTAAAVSMGLAVAGSCFSLMWSTLGRKVWGKVFTGDDEVLKLMRAILPVIGICELANCPQTTGCGVLRGSARPSVGAAINLYSFYLVGAPMALALAFWCKMGFMGLCLGLLSAQVVCALSVAFATFSTDWEGVALKALALVGGGPSKVESPKANLIFEGDGLLKVPPVLPSA